MPRRKTQIENELENVSESELSPIRDIESDEIVMKEFSEEDAAAAKEQLEEMDERKRINASRTRKRNLYRHDSYASLDIDDEDDDLVTEERLRYENFQKLNMSLVSGSILMGEVVKSMRRSNNPEKPEMPTAIVRMPNDDYFTIKIPFTDFLPKDRLPELIRGETAADKLNYMDLLINMRTGAKVYFIVQKLDEQTGEVIASRTKAMSRLISDKWFSRDREGRFDVAWLGREVKGRIVFVTRSQIGVEAMGIEKTLNMADISWQRYSDLRTAPLRPSREEVTNKIIMRPYREGDSVLLRITGIKRIFRDTEGNLVDDTVVGNRRDVRPAGIAVKLSIKESSENPDVKYFKQFSLGEKVKAQITHIDENGNGIFCKLSELRSAKIMFSQDNNAIPQIGSYCLVRITGMNEENYQINCEIVQMYR